MRSFPWMFSAGAALLSLSAFAAEPAKPTAAPDKPAAEAASAENEEGFKPLFNGKDLTGWIYGKKGTAENKSGKGYQVDPEAKTIYCTKEDGGNLYTDKEYGDFVFRFEFKLTPNANNGIAIRAPLEGDSAYQGMEIQVIDDEGPSYKGKLKEWQYHGSIYNVVPAKSGSLKPVGEWNVEEITAKGRQITIKVNGKVIVDANLDDVKDEQTLKKHPGLKREKGHIGFLGHGARVEFRNLRIKDL
jgi:hypothetical protein